MLLVTSLMYKECVVYKIIMRGEQRNNYHSHTANIHIIGGGVCYGVNVDDLVPVDQENDLCHPCYTIAIEQHECEVRLLSNQVERQYHSPTLLKI